MHEKTARATIANLLHNAHTEQQENIKRAFANGQATILARSEEKQAAQPYSNKHQMALIGALGDLVGLVER
jgi:hypothetical protein